MMYPTRCREAGRGKTTRAFPAGLRLAGKLESLRVEPLKGRERKCPQPVETAAGYSASHPATSPATLLAAVVSAAPTRLASTLPPLGSRASKRRWVTLLPPAATSIPCQNTTASVVAPSPPQPGGRPPRFLPGAGRTN